MRIIDGFARFIGEMSQESVRDQIRIESMEDELTITCKDGSLMSMISLSGALQTPGLNDMDNIVERLRIILSSYFSKPGHLFEISFLRDSASARRHLERIVDRSSRAARALGLDLDDVFTERVANLPRFLTDETCLISVYTRPSILSSEEMREEVKIVGKRTRGIPLMVSAQTPGKILDALHSRHTSMVQAFVGALTGVGQVARCLSVREALQEMRAGLYPGTSAHKEEWLPNLAAWSHENHDMMKPGGRIMDMAPEKPAERAMIDFSNLGVPTFDIQLATEDAFIENSRTVRIGDMDFSAFDMTLVPEVLPEFNALVADITAKNRNTPWRMTMRMESGGVQSQQIKMMFLSIITWSTQSHNQRLRDAILRLRDIDGQEDAVVRFRMSFCTWAPVGHQDKLRANYQSLIGAVKRWGNAGADGVSGDPLATVLSTVPGATPASTAPVAAGPMRDVIAMMPLARQASPWKTGSMMLRTPSGKPWPFEPGSSLQTTWVTLLVGTPGSGKSVFMNALNFASAIAPNLAGGNAPVLPRISIIDIGYSSSGVISLLKEALPANRRHEVVFQRLRMDRSNAINVFDTQLGMRQPLSAERQFLVNFMNLICSDGDKSPNGAMGGLISATIDQVYDDFSDSRSPRPYMPDDEPKVDKALAKIGMETGEATIWWDVVDELMKAGLTYEAEIAQRHAVPIVSDLVSASQSDQVISLYGQTMNPETKEPLVSSFQRMISEIVRDYPILSSHTRFSIGSSRVVALDLEDVTAKGTGPQALKRTSLMYMVARQVMTRSYFLDEGEIVSFAARGLMPKIYLDYHVKAARDNMKVPKIICMDEFHRTGKIKAIVDQVIQDAREGRKYNVDIRIASQFIEDFPVSMIEAATALIVCNSGTENSIDYIDKIYNLSVNDRQIMRYNLRGPGANGAPIWMLMKLKGQGEIRQELNLTLGPAEIWAFSTTSEDVALRRLLYDTIGPRLARRVLAIRFPGGTAKPEIEARVLRQEESGERLDDDARLDLIGNFAEELAKQALMLDERAK